MDIFKDALTLITENPNIAVSIGAFLLCAFALYVVLQIVKVLGVKRK